MQVLSGSEIRNEILNELKNEVSKLNEQKIFPSLAVILIGDDPASAVYVRNKGMACKKTGIRSIEKKLPANTSQTELLNLINELNNNSEVSGILCQLPVPDHLDENKLIQAINPVKDVDCLHPYNLGLLTAGSPRFMPCTPFGVLQILKRKNIETKGKNVVVLGRSNIVGRPLSILMSLKGQDSTVTVCHSKTENLEETCRNADILIGAIGRPRFITKNFIKPGATVIDVGINRIDDPEHPKGGYLVGDVDYKNIQEIAAAATPVPGGVGPMTIAMLMFNTINAARYQAGLEGFEL